MLHHLLSYLQTLRISSQAAEVIKYADVIKSNDKTLGHIIQA